MYETEVEMSWALFLDTQYSRCASELRRMVWVLRKDFERLHRRSSSTYWMSLLGGRSRELRYCCMAWPKR
jgi:hypothetical protein